MRTKSPARRRSGRPPQGADVESREALLDAAVTLIAERGVAATSSADIAGKAGVTPAMVHYHFRKRDLLLDAVVDERLARFAGYVFAAPLPKGPATDLVAAVVRRLYAAATLMPWMPPIWVREIVSDGGALRSRMLGHFPVAAATGLANAVARDQRAGHIARGVEPRLTFLTIAAVVMLPLAVRSLWSRLPDLADLDERVLERHALAVLTAGLAPAGKGRKR